MLEAAKPLMKWIAEKGHPHIKAIVENNHIELVEGICTGRADATEIEVVHDAIRSAMNYKTK